MVHRGENEGIFHPAPWAPFGFSPPGPCMQGTATLRPLCLWCRESVTPAFPDSGGQHGCPGALVLSIGFYLVWGLW